MREDSEREEKGRGTINGCITWNITPAILMIKSIYNNTDSFMDNITH